MQKNFSSKAARKSLKTALFCAVLLVVFAPAVCAGGGGKCPLNASKHLISAAASPAPAPSVPPALTTDSLDTLKIVLPYGRHNTTVTFTGGLFLTCFNTSTDYVFGTDYTVTAPATQTFSVGIHHVTWTVRHKSGSSAPSFLPFNLKQVVQVELPPCAPQSYDGYDYPAVRIGYYCWLAENLRNEHYADGAAVPDTRFYNDDATLLEKYGRLYTWNATMRADAYGHPATGLDHTVQGVCPDGWRLPTEADFTLMVNSSGELANVKSNENEYYWLHGLRGEDPQSGFKALPGGCYSSSYRGLWGEGHFWLYDPDITRARGADVWHYCPDIMYSTVPKEYGYSVRCIKREPITPAVVATGEVTHIVTNSADCKGYVISDGGLPVAERGICWSTSQNPTIADSHTTNGSGTGSFTGNITGLTPGTTYYVRAYATNALGTAYGNEVRFATALPFSDETFTVNGVTFTMKPVQGGTFWMGAQSANSGGWNYDSEASSNEQPVHQVTLTQDYWMGETEVTQKLWLAVMGSWPGTDVPNDTYGLGDDYPAYYISWNDIQDFLSALNTATASQRGARTFVLPTEAQWEFAARGGTESEYYYYDGGNPITTPDNTKYYKYAGSDNIENVAWYYHNSVNIIHQVKGKQSNELGLCDMSGNVWEWCSDWYDINYYSSSPSSNPTGPSSGSKRVLRGGSYGYYAPDCRVSSRSNSNGGKYTRGFRLALVPSL